MGSYHYHTALRAKIGATSELEIARHLTLDANEFRSRANRYRCLADGLADPRVTAEVHACARELETKAAEIEKLVAFELQTMLGARAKAIQLTNAASFSCDPPIPCEVSAPARWIINSWCEF